MAPFGVKDKRDYHEADLAASNVIGIWQLAFGPVPVDGANEKSFHERWIRRFGEAASGRLRPPQYLPLPKDHELQHRADQPELGAVYDLSAVPATN